MNDDTMGEYVLKLVLWTPLTIIGAFPMALLAWWLASYLPVPELGYWQWYAAVVLIRVLLPK